jgi:hypothetical protein
MGEIVKLGTDPETNTPVYLVEFEDGRWLVVLRRKSSL